MSLFVSPRAHHDPAIVGVELEQQARLNRRWLYAGRGVRSFSTALLAVVFPLYLAADHYSSARIGLVITVGGFISAGMVLAVGLAGDRFGRRNVLMVVSALGVVGGVLLAGTADVVAVMAANGLCGVGRGGGAGSGGSFGAVFPAEQPLLAAAAPGRTRTAAFARMSLIGVAAAAGGSLVAWLPDILHSSGWSWLGAYRLVFVISAALALVMVATVIPIRERRPPRSLNAERPAKTDAQTSAQPATSRLSTSQLLKRLGFANLLNGFGFGFLGPMLVYWFHVRFGAGPGLVGVLYTVINVITIVSYLAAAPLTRRLGSVSTVVYTRAVAMVCMLAMLWTPTFLLAGIAYALRMLVSSLGLPARQSYVMGVADERRRSTIAAAGMLPAQLSSSVSPSVAGALMDSLINVPIIGALVFQSANVVAYYLSFRRHPPPEEQAPIDQTD